jgi:hypothetical protein
MDLPEDAHRARSDAELGRPSAEKPVLFRRGIRDLDAGAIEDLLHAGLRVEEIDTSAVGFPAVESRPAHDPDDALLSSKSAPLGSRHAPLRR